MTLSDPSSFFAAVRTELFGGALSQRQVDGINAILAAWPEGTDPRWIAYGLATACHETAGAMEPVSEWGCGHGRPYGVPCGPYGRIYYGRGLVQLTWLVNYERAAREIPASDLVRTPDNALKPATAADILVRGMTDGWFTGKKLEDYFPLAQPLRADWLYAREIINGVDHAALIAGYAVHFHHALKGSPTRNDPESL